MHMISVVIPFFQREPGILTRALNSITLQHVPDGWSVEVIVVDDGSPRPAYDEVSDFSFKEPVRLKIFRQENGGVGAARNRGLEEADPSATVIAFLDSDDIWPVNHLAHARSRRSRKGSISTSRTTAARDTMNRIGTHPSWRRQPPFSMLLPRKPGSLRSHKI